MNCRRTNSVAGARRCIIAAACGLLLLAGVPAGAQETRPSPDYQPGMLDSMGRWFKNSFSRFGSTVDDAREAAKEAAEVAREAAVKFPNARMVEGRERCTVAENGGPDCRKAAEAVCKAKGFGSGASLEIQSSQKCPARVWISGRSSERGECENQSYVLRAMCQ